MIATLVRWGWIVGHADCSARTVPTEAGIQSQSVIPFYDFVMRNSLYQDCTISGRQVAVATKFFAVALNVCGLVSCHPFGALNFETALRFLENLHICGLYLCIWRPNFLRISFGLECPLVARNLLM
jgi:hypothetical protein